MASITANQIKTKGVSILEEEIGENNTAMITVRGKSKYVVMGLETYNHLRECELEAAIVETRKELEKGEIFKDTVDEHIQRILNEL